MTEPTAEKDADLQRLLAENMRLKQFRDIGAVLAGERDIDRLIPIVMTETSRSLKADRSTLFLIDWDRMELWTKFAEGLEDQRLTLKLKMGLVGLCALTGRPVNVPNAYEDPRFNSSVDQVTGFRTESVLCVPFHNQAGEVIGALELMNKTTGLFAPEDERTALETAERFTALGQGLPLERAEALIGDLRRRLDCDRGTVFRLDRETGTLSSIVAEGLGGRQIDLSLNLGVAGLVAVTGRELNIPDAQHDPRFDRTADQNTGYRTRCLLCVPLHNQVGEIMGVLEAINKIDGTFTQEDADFLRDLSYQVSIFLENAMLFSEQRRQFRSVVEVLAASIDAKDPMTLGHSHQVTRYATAIARELGFGETEIDILSVAAMLHDYGKLGTDDRILKKPGRLTPEEFEHIKEHVANTRSILEKMYFIPRYRNVPLIASSHHERLDGTGYQQGLKGGEIPFMARILAVADVFDALTADRHYRKAMSPAQAFEILDQGVGTSFDGHIVAALKRWWHASGPGAEG
jgi:putative nucleotidyltransferase with HDIG domain